MPIKKKNLARLSSLGALGAGALGVAAGNADATVIYNNFGGTPQSFSPTGSFQTHFGSYSAPGFRVFGQGWQYGPNSWGPNPYSSFSVRGASGSGYANVMMSGLNGLRFRSGDALQGANWNLLSGSQSWAPLANRNSNFWRYSRGRKYSGYEEPFWYVTSSSSIRSADPYGPKGPFYKLFRFTSASGDLFGWAEFNVVANGFEGGGFSPSSTAQGYTQVDLIAYAYSNSGYMLPAGDLSEPSDVPEPGSAGLMSLGALALGAMGMRRWRAARKKAS